MNNVSIIIPTYQGSKWLSDTLSAIRSQEYVGDIEIIAIDSSSTDDTRDILQIHGAKIKVIEKSEFSHGYARNLGVELSSHPIIVFMSQDALPVGTDWLLKIVSLLDDPAIGAAHVQQLPRANATPLEVFFHNELYPAKSKRYHLSDDEQITLDKLFFSNVCSVTWRNLVLKYPFPENIIMSEDQAFAKSLLLAGYDTLYSAEVQVVHSHHYSLPALFRRHFDSAYSLIDITDDTLASNASAGIQYIWREFMYLLNNKHWAWLAYMPIYEFTRIFARLLGARAEFIPMELRKQMSLHRTYWQRNQVVCE